MSIQGLVGGAECGTINPLAQMLKHAEGDRSIQQDRIAGPSSSRLHHLPSTSVGPTNERDVAMVRQFFDVNAQGSNAGPSFVVPHYIPPTDMARIHQMNGHPGGRSLSEAWAREQEYRHAAPESKVNAAAWTFEFGQGLKPSILSPSIQREIGSRTDFQQQSSYVTPGGLYGSAMSMGMNGMGMFQPAHFGTTDQGKGKGKLKQADFEAAFAAFDQQPESPRIVEVDDGVTGVEEAMKNATLLSDQNEGRAQFQEVWDQLQNSDVPPPQADLAKWEAEFNQLMNSGREDDVDYDFGSSMREALQSGLEPDQFSPQQFDDEGLPILTPYAFEPHNKYLGPLSSTRSPLAEAKSLLDQNGSLSEAALLLEAAVQKGELGEGGYETWILLGETRNMDEREEAGMRALVEGVKRAEAAGAAGVGQLSLAISYTNESYERASYATLLRWLRARFPSHPIPEDTIYAVKNHSTWDAHNRVTDVFLNLVRTQHIDEGRVDPDVQIGLGVLFYTNSEFDRAKDCFESALSARPGDYLLWNRLGSSLSNGNKPEEALGAYREALNLRPTYTRAIYNVGVACLNIGAHKEAAEHFLSALSMQQSNNGETSDQLWFTLRRALMSMDRGDLADISKPDNKPNLELFRKEGFDF